MKIGAPRAASKVTARRLKRELGMSDAQIATVGSPDEERDEVDVLGVGSARAGSRPRTTSRPEELRARVAELPHARSSAPAGWTFTRLFTAVTPTRRDLSSC